MKNLTKIIFLVSAIIIFICVFFYAKDVLLAPGFEQVFPGQVCFKLQSGLHCFLVELAKTESEMESGLMFRKKLDGGTGMLFVFSKEDNYPFWMKDTLIPLDIIWINGKSEVVYISKDNQPCREENCPIVYPSAKAKYVLEIGAGLAEEMGLITGEKADIVMY